MIQVDFSGGMNLFDQDFLLKENEYSTAFNVRNKNTSLQVVKDLLEDEDAPVGKKQGLFAFDQILVLFVNGLCYYRNINSTGWTQINNVFLSPIVDYIYCEAVPASRFNFNRKLETANVINGTALEPKIEFTQVIVNGTQSGLVVQDGINQPFLILSTGTAITLNTYAQWTTSNRQYVPIMKQMRYVNGILFGTDGINIFRSVSGRPLDFVVNVTQTGDKGGDAYTTSFSVSTEQLTCLSSLNSGELFAATTKIVYPIEFNYDKLIFGEPTFFNRRQMSAGVVNQYSLIEILGDYSFVDLDGIRTFDAVKTLQNEGRNSIMSENISKILTPKQIEDEVATILFDNYALFSLDTIYGNLIAVFDTLHKQWVSLDQFEDTDAFKQFAVANQTLAPKLYGITEDKVYALYSAETYANGEVLFKSTIVGSLLKQARMDNVYCVFRDNTIVGNSSMTEVIDDYERPNVITQPLLPNNAGNLITMRYNFERLNGTGFKVAPKLNWSTDGKLVMLETEIATLTYKTSISQQSIPFA